MLSSYMDNILQLKNNEYVNEIKKQLSSNFEMKDMSEAAYIFEVNIARDHS